MREFRDVFPETLPPLSPEYLDRVRTRHRIKSIAAEAYGEVEGRSLPDSTCSSNAFFHFSLHFLGTLE
jgi:hypothetical protein